MSFCVECGAEGEVYGGLCGKCLVARRTFFDVPEAIDLVQCVHCHAYRVGDRWIPGDRQEATARAVEGRVKIRGELADPAVAYRERVEDERNLLLTVEGKGRVGEVDVVETHETRVRIRNGVCDVCSRRRGLYYEGILQVRATERPLRPWEEAKVGEIVAQRTQRREGSQAFISKEERVHGGVDYYLSSNGLAKALTREIQGSLGGEVKVSPKLHSRREGRDLYRVTYLVRLPPYALGDVVQVEGEYYQITTVGAAVGTVALRDGAHRSLKGAELLRSPVVGRQEAQAMVIAQNDREVQILDPQTYRTETLPIPRGFDRPGASVTILRVGGQTFVAPLQGPGYGVRR